MAVTQILHLYTVSERMSTSNNEEHFKTNKIPNEISLFTNKLVGHVTKAAAIEVFLIPKSENALAGTSRLVKDRSQKSESIQERSLNKLAVDVNTLCARKSLVVLYTVTNLTTTH